MSEPTRWYVLPVNHHQEATAAGSVLRSRLSLFYPRYWTTISHARRMVDELRPLIVGLLFVRPMIAGDVAWIDSLSRQPGIGALKRDDGLLTVGTAEMQVFRREFDEDGVLTPRRPSVHEPRFRPGDRAPLVDGPMSGQGIVAEILKVDGTSRVRVLIPLLQRLVETEVPEGYLGDPAVSPDLEAGGRNSPLAPNPHLNRKSA